MGESLKLFGSSFPLPLQISSVLAKITNFYQKRFSIGIIVFEKSSNFPVPVFPREIPQLINHCFTPFSLYTTAFYQSYPFNLM